MWQSNYLFFYFHSVEIPVFEKFIYYLVLLIHKSKKRLTMAFCSKSLTFLVLWNRQSTAVHLSKTRVRLCYRQLL
jgi:hypothetical protein